MGGEGEKEQKGELSVMPLATITRVRDPKEKEITQTGITRCEGAGAELAGWNRKFGEKEQGNMR